MNGIAWLQRKLLFPSPLVQRPGPPPSIEGLESWWIETEQGKVEVWFLPGQGVSAQHPGPVVLFAHGNGELIDHWPHTLAPYRALGISVVLPEYRGYGRSPGKPSEPALVSDLRTLLARMTQDPRVDMNRLVYHGRSLGGGVVCALARVNPPKALILESTFTSVVDVARGMGLPSFLIYDKFESLPVVEAHAGPVLVMHGRKDTLIPVRHGERLAAANPRARLALWDVGHNDLPPPQSSYWQEVEQTLRQAFSF